MAKLADATDSNSVSSECGFESHFGYLPQGTLLLRFLTGFPVYLKIPNIKNWFSFPKLIFYKKYDIIFIESEREKITYV